MTTLYNLFRLHPHISTDSRRIEPDSLFFALKGASFDGNRFAADALAKGAAYAVVDDASLPTQHPDLNDRLVVVEDVLQALQALAREHRRELGIPILAITGSNGKTTTKELVTRVLSEKYTTYATHGNLNNHIGVPLTLLAMSNRTEFGVVEMGASACGEIALLTSIAEPDYGIITNVGLAHLEGFGGPEGVRRGKGELLDYLAAHGGTAFIRKEDPVLSEMADQRPGLHTDRYSTSQAEGVAHHLEGVYNRFNVAAAVAVGHHFNIEEKRIRKAITSYHPDNNRSQRFESSYNTLILDCYNANPSSMQAALLNFRTEPLEGRSQKVLILGDMLELGDWSQKEHCRILALAAEIPEARLLLVGDHFAQAYNSLAEKPARTSLYQNQHRLAEALKREPIRNALILIKGSRGIGLETTTEQL